MLEVISASLSIRTLKSLSKKLIHLAFLKINTPYFPIKTKSKRFITEINVCRTLQALS
jgi:hypothetical protein